MLSPSLSVGGALGGKPASGSCSWAFSAEDFTLKKIETSSIGFGARFGLCFLTG